MYILISAILLLYLPIAYGGYFVYGESTHANIVQSLKSSSLVILANIFMVAHLILAFFIVINPVAQEIENIFDVPHGKSNLTDIIFQTYH